MAAFSLTRERLELLASCITIGLEGADQNHVDTGGENTSEDLQAIAALLEELDAIAAKGIGAEITVVSNGAYARANCSIGAELDRVDPAVPA